MEKIATAPAAAIAGMTQVGNAREAVAVARAAGVTVGEGLGVTAENEGAGMIFAAKRITPELLGAGGIDDTTQVALLEAKDKKGIICGLAAQDDALEKIVKSKPEDVLATSRARIGSVFQYTGFPYATVDGRVRFIEPDVMSVQPVFPLRRTVCEK